MTLPSRTALSVIAVCWVTLAGPNCVAASNDSTAPDRPAVIENCAAFVQEQIPRTYEEMSRYVDQLMARSDRVQVSTYGTSALGRRLRVVVISSPDNLRRLDWINARLAELASGTLGPGAEAAITGSIPAIVWLGYGIHADELSGSDAGLRLIERLVTSQDPATRKILENLVVYVDPMANPDGRERFMARTETYRRRTPVVDPQDIVQTPPWPPGRLNHYLMDLNRDALFLTQPESVARLTAILNAHPQLFTDAHEMVYPSNYLIAAPGEPLNPYVPAAVRRAWDRFAAAIGNSFDRIGQSYYRGSWDEVFYPGYYDILPAYGGVTPLLFEQGRSSGVGIQLPNGRTRSFADAVANHLRASWTTLETASDQRLQLLVGWLEARRANARERHDGGPATWYVPPEDAYKSSRLREILDAHQITHYQLTDTSRVASLRSIWNATPEAHVLPPGTIVVPTSQPASGVVRNLFDYHVPMDATFLAGERRRIDLGQKTQIYDVTAWSAPLAFDVTAYWAPESNAGLRQVAGTSAADANPQLQSAGYGYIYQDFSLFVTARLLERGVRVRVATEPFATAQKPYGRGTLLIRNDDQSPNLSAVLQEEARRSHTLFAPIGTARSREGPDLGDDRFALLVRPRIGLLMSGTTLAMSVGAVWQLLDEQIGVPVTLLDVDRLRDLDLSAYNVLLIPDAENHEALATELLQGAESLKSWIRSGGTLVTEAAGVVAAVRSGLTAIVPSAAGDAGVSARAQAAWPAQGTSALLVEQNGTAAVAAKGGLDQTKAPVISEAAQAVLGQTGRGASSAALKTLPGVCDTRALPAITKRYLPHGAYLRVDLKPLHWLGYGAHERLPVLFREQNVLAANDAVELIGRYARSGELPLAGLIWPEAVSCIAESAYLTRERIGRGQVIDFAADPAFRGYSLGTQRLLLNAMILGPGMLTQ